jgi:hypothetical protein
MNATSKKLKTKKNNVIVESGFFFFIESCEHFQSFGNHKSMSVESVMEKLQKITKEKET